MLCVSTLNTSLRFWSRYAIQPYWVRLHSKYIELSFSYLISVGRGAVSKGQSEYVETFFSSRRNNFLRRNDLETSPKDTSSPIRNPPYAGVQTINHGFHTLTSPAFSLFSYDVERTKKIIITTDPVGPRN